MEEVNKEPHEVIFDYLHACAYQGYGLGRTILGPKENIQSIQRDDLIQYVKKYYTAPRMVVAARYYIIHRA
jgi:processing peptidase subunit beta